MCCCWPFKSFPYEEPPKKTKKEEPKKEDKTEWVLVPEGAVLHQSPQYVQQPQPYYAPQPAAPPAPAPAPAPTKTEQYTHYHWYGNTRAQVDAENVSIAHYTGATKPTQLVPHNPSASQQWWCRELDGTYTLRNTNDIMENLQPGFWQYAQPGGYPYFIRQEKT